MLNVLDPWIFTHQRQHVLLSHRPQVGDIVEYPLREIETQDFDDGRTHGLGLLVSRNMDRGKQFSSPAIMASTG